MVSFYKLFVSLQWKCTGQRVCFERFEKVKLKFRTAQNTTRFSVLGSQPDVNKAHTNNLRHRYATPKTELFQFLEPQFLFLLTVVFKKQKRFFRCLFRKKTPRLGHDVFSRRFNKQKFWRTTVLKITKFSQRWNQLPVTEFVLLQFLLEALFCVCLPPPAPTCLCPAPSDAPSVRQQILNKLYHCVHKYFERYSQGIRDRSAEIEVPWYR